MTRRGVLLVGLLVLSGCAALTVPIFMFVVSIGSMSDRSEDCGPAGGTTVQVVANPDTARQLNEDQRANAAVIVSEGYQLGVPRRGIIVALAVANQESRFLNYANDGLGSDLMWMQAGIEDSRALPHQAVGSDHGSLGIFQQQWPWWGSMESLMNPAKAAGKFYRALLHVPGWERMPVTVAGQAVQRSAYPDAYADDVPLAKALLDDASMANPASVGGSALDGGCAVSSMAPGAVTSPLPNGSFTDAQNWGAAGAAWTEGHTGTDFAAACGTPVLAATAGTVIARSDQPWSGRWLVQVTTGVGRLTTWYGHMQALDVVDGQEVRPGQQLGQVGNEGNSRGCHLHFEVHPRGGTIYEDNIDPTAWLRQNVGRRLDVDRNDAFDGSGFILATFNVLGHSHTKPGGNKPGWEDSTTRMRRTVHLIDRHDVDVIGLQELQPQQARTFRQLAGSSYELHSPPGDTENSIAWRRSRWSFVGAETVAIPYFNGRIRQMPIVRLRDRATNMDSVFVNVHNPANTRRFPRQERHRAEAVRRQASVIEELRQRYEVPVYLTGDLNDRHEAFCRLTEGGLMTASAGGSNDEACRPPARAGIDWIFGPTDTRFADHRQVRTADVRRSSDHPFVVAQVGGSDVG